MFEILLKRVLLLLQGLLAIRKGFVFGNNDVPANDTEG